MADDDPPNAGPPEAPPSNKVVDLEKRRARARQQALSAPYEARLDQARKKLPPGCPYTPVGFDGERYYLIDSQAYLRTATPHEMTQRWVVSVCGGAHWLKEHYPRFRQGKPVDGFQADAAAEHIMLGCHILGYWSESGRIRGRGAWPGVDDDLILHRGDHLLIAGRETPTGRHGEYVYPKRGALPRLPRERQAGGPHGPGALLLARLDTFQWQRGTFDAQLLLGWIGCSLVGGALPFRPHVLISGDFQTGKSLAQAVLAGLNGPGGSISVSDTSAAALWQSFDHDTLPAGIDEMESENAERADSIIRLARQASSGGLVLRGDSRHRAVEFVVRSCFCCSAISPPAMTAADASRFVTLQLLPLPVGIQHRPFDFSGLPQLGVALLRRIVDSYKRFRDELTPRAREALAGHGFQARTIDLYAPLIAMNEALLYDELGEDRLTRFASSRFMADILATAQSELTPDWRRCLDHLFAAPSDPRVRGCATMGDLVAAVARALQGSLFEGEADAADHARLKACGLKVEMIADDYGAEPVLVVANTHPELGRIFTGSRWASRSDAVASGWHHSLSRVPGAKPRRAVTRFSGGVITRALSLPLTLALPSDPAPPASPQPAAEQERRRQAH